MSGEVTSPVALRCAGLSRSVGRRRILESVDLEVAPGELVVVTGPSGAGKTTLLRLIAGLDRPSAGTIEIDGKIVSSPGRVTAPMDRSVGMVFEHAALWPHFTVAQHLAVVLRPRMRISQIRPRVESLMESLRIGALRDRYPHELSGGERQRVALARSLAPEPRLLLLDEPLAHLDVHLAADLAQTLAEIHGERRLTTICVMHRPDQVNAIADRYVVLEQGSITQSGTADVLFRSPKGEFASALAQVLGYESGPAGRT